ncbi:hypothetical protein [Hansschlegelia beijingensis]|uniref:Pyrrolidone-carboxylate peptidase n=1 Tax=Hansschlegelia beijingensis TaxID=1133344 RepID=A0A7W6CZL4_9HYPH|nr:hypothetical protein [Hansschlegelia beijingensis]MBB3974003.1 pyroglutamyl-peptidase [Hansschlegelia beijingensis]
MSLLITGFGRFMGGPNCSEILLSALAADRAGLEGIWGGPVALELLPVDVEAAPPALARALQAARPTHVLLMGQAGGREAICLERVARNLIDLRVPDAAGRLGPIGPVDPAGPGQRLSTWPDLEGAISAARAEGVRAELSDQAGAHLCNQMLYLALEAAEQAAGRPFVATFLHLPLLPEQFAAGIPAAHGAPASITLDDMMRATRAILRHTREAAV